MIKLPTGLYARKAVEPYIKEIKRLKGALEFYADINNYSTPPISLYGSVEGSNVMIDHGIKARQVLQEKK